MSEPHLLASSPAPQARIGIGVLVVRLGAVLVGRRQGSHGAGTWAVPGGHLEFGETIESCARRELLEETGLMLARVIPAPYAESIEVTKRRHYVTLFVQGLDASGDPQTREPDKCAGWEWHRWSALPQPLFTPLETLRASGFVPAGAA